MRLNLKSKSYDQVMVMVAVEILLRLLHLLRLLVLALLLLLIGLGLHVLGLSGVHVSLVGVHFISCGSGPVRAQAHLGLGHLQYPSDSFVVCQNSY